MSKKFSKKTTTKRQYKLSPKDAQEILRKEFIDNNGNRHILDINFRPHSPFKEGDMKLKYKMNNQKGE